MNVAIMLAGFFGLFSPLMVGPVWPDYGALRDSGDDAMARVGHEEL
jgi:hypothetical protein